MIKNEGGKLRRVVVCSPKTEYTKVNDPKAHNIERVADRTTAVQQHDTLKETLSGSGCEVIDIQELAGHPNSVFTRDTALVTPTGYVHLRMGLRTRRGEESWMADVLEFLGERCIGRIIDPATVEGGDVILAGSVAFVGHSLRTNEEGIRQISSLLKWLGYEVRQTTVPMSSLHIGGTMSIVGPQLVLCCRGIFADDFFDGFDTIQISPDTFSGGNVICLSEKEAIVNIANTEAIDKLESAGITVHALDLSEFVKGMGGPSCLVLPVDRESSATAHRSDLPQPPS